MKKHTILIIGVLILVVAIPLATYLIVKGFETQEVDITGSTAPINLRITSQSSSGFTIEWDTLSPTVGYIRFGTDIQDLDQFEFGDDGITEATSHSIKLERLESDTKYYYLIVTNDQTYSRSDDTPFSYVTLPNANQQ